MPLIRLIPCNYTLCGCFSPDTNLKTDTFTLLKRTIISRMNQVAVRMIFEDGAQKDRIYRIPDRADAPFPNGCKDTNSALILVPGINDSSEGELATLLDKILISIGLSRDNVLLANSQEAPALRDLDPWNKSLPKRLIMLFGCNPQSLDLQLRWIPNRPVQVGRCLLIVTHSLPELQASTDAKKALWGCLKAVSPLLSENS